MRNLLGIMSVQNFLWYPHEPKHIQLLPHGNIYLQLYIIDSVTKRVRFSRVKIVQEPLEEPAGVGHCTLSTLHNYMTEHLSLYINTTLISNITQFHDKSDLSPWNRMLFSDCHNDRVQARCLQDQRTGVEDQFKD